MSRLRSYRLGILATCIALPWVMSGRAESQQPAVSEYAVKAVLFFKLPQFVYLPEGRRGQALTVCAMGDHPVSGALDKLSRTTPEGRAATFLNVDTTGEAARCDFLFVTRAEVNTYESILQHLGGSRVVTVSDIVGFAKNGGMIEFAPNPDGNGVQILVNRKAARRQGIEFNAQLLRLARIIEP
jgi:hypothetical protein